MDKQIRKIPDIGLPKQKTKEEEILSTLESFKFKEMNQERRISLINEMYGIPIIPEDIKYITVVGNDGKHKKEWNFEWIVSLISARVDLAPVPKVFLK